MSAKALCSVLLAGALLAGMCAVPAAAAGVRDDATAAVRDGAALLTTGADAADVSGLSVRYRAYIQARQDRPVCSQTYSLDMSAAAPEGEAQVQGGQLTLPAGSTAQWNIQVPQSGLYPVELEYRVCGTMTTPAEVSLLIDGTVPFFEASCLTLRNRWQDEVENGVFQTDSRGNDRKPGQKPTGEWQRLTLENDSGYTNGPLLLYLEKGGATLTLRGVKGTVELRAVTLGGYSERQSAAQYQQAFAGQPDNAQEYYVEAELPYRKSSFSLYPLSDNASAATSPQSPQVARLNTIGSTKWQTAGEWISWEFDAVESGWYQLSLRYRQNVVSGSTVTRALYVDGEIPFAEAEQITFAYDGDWQTAALAAADGTPLKLYLTAGRHEIALKVTLGQIADCLGEMDQLLRKLNEMYREILMITGSSPDYYQDYNFGKKIPDTIAHMETYRQVLLDTVDRLEQLAGKKGEQTALLEKLAYQLEQMHEKPSRIASMLGSFKSNIGALGTWLQSNAAQPLELDWLMLQPYGAQVPRAEKGFFANFWFGVQSFFYSFTNDYSLVGDTSGAEENITVWIVSGRDQARIISQLVRERFLPGKDFGVKLSLVSAGTLLPSVLAGVGPDISLSNGASEPINYAIRGAVEPLEGYDGFSEVAGRFYESAFVPFTYRGHVYAIPETQSFYVMFYRTDLFEEMGITPPETWKDFKKLIPMFKHNGMDIGFPASLAGTLLLLTQSGADLYRNEGEVTNLDSDAGLTAFDTMCGMFITDGLPREYDFATRFRSGEMPLAIADYTIYNTLAVYAPEIKGLWNFTLIPGTVRADGTVDHSSTGSGMGAMMMANSRHKQQAWEFLKWWTQADTQSTYAYEMESLLGASAKVALANREAFADMAWTAEEYAALSAQWALVKGIPEVPGGYYTSRCVDFAFNKVYNERVDPSETLLKYIKEINYELARKRAEFDR
ncbi:MAG: extracellular solute-binding protein [Clostridia bacterium]|nr:extracellular solute-binding protein [Clostridia bacterium]